MFRGLVFGMTDRMPYGGNTNPAMWQFWDSIGLVDSEMVGFWDPVPAVNTSVPGVYATAYITGSRRALVCVASWAPSTVAVTLSFNWARLGLDPAHVSQLRAPAIAGVQAAATYPLHAALPLPAASTAGLLLLLEQDA